jgi:hypothetical protein
MEPGIRTSEGQVHGQNSETHTRCRPPCSSCSATLSSSKVRAKSKPSCPASSAAPSARSRACASASNAPFTAEHTATRHTTCLSQPGDYDYNHRGTTHMPPLLTCNAPISFSWRSCAINDSQAAWPRSRAAARSSSAASAAAASAARVRALSTAAAAATAAASVPPPSSSSSSSEVSEGSLEGEEELHCLSRSAEMSRPAGWVFPR